MAGNSDVYDSPALHKAPGPKDSARYGRNYYREALEGNIGMWNGNGKWVADRG